MDSLQEKLFLQARKQGAKVPTQALMADALVEMARSYRDAKGGRGGPKCLATLRVDYSALKRGHTKEGEVCEIAGVGPVSAAVAKDYLSDCIFKVLVTKGKDVLTLAHGGYNITASLRSFLDETYPTCVVLGCNETRRLEIDHVIPWPEGPSAPWNTVQICNRHHYLKTYKGYTLGPRVNGKAELIPPNKSRSRASPSE